MNLNNEVALGHFDHVRDLKASGFQRRVRFETRRIHQIVNQNILNKKKAV